MSQLFYPVPKLSYNLNLLNPFNLSTIRIDQIIIFISLILNLVLVLIRLDLTKEQSTAELMTIEMPDGFKKMTCPVDPICKSYKYRTNDGSCNSQVIPNLGRSLTTYRRLAPPDYADGKLLEMKFFVFN